MITIPAGQGYGEKLRELLVDSLGEDGAWLLLSMDHYNWRARYDLAKSLVDGGTSHSQHHGRHLQSVIDLEVQSGLYAVVELLARLLKAIAVHRDGTPTFFDAYVRTHNIHDLIDWMRTLDRSAIDEMLGLPVDGDALLQGMEQFGLASDPEIVDAALQGVHLAFDELQLNLQEFALMVQRWDLSGSGAPVEEGHSLRTVDNAYRHGLKVLMHDALPLDRTFEIAIHREADPLGEYAVDLFQSTTEPKFATIDASPDRTEAHLKAIEAVSVRIKQIVRAFIARLTGQAVVFVTFHNISVDDIDVSLLDSVGASEATEP